MIAIGVLQLSFTLSIDSTSADTFRCEYRQFAVIVTYFCALE